MEALKTLKNPLVIIIAILLLVLVVVIVICCFMNKDKFRARLVKGKTTRQPNTLKSSADPPAVKCASVPQGGCSFFKCDMCIDPKAASYCVKGKSQCEECGDSAIWCVNGKPTPRPPPPPPPPRPTQCEQTNHPVRTITRNFPDVFGYFGNSEAASGPGQGGFDTFPDIYNIVVLTFVEFDKNAKFSLVIQGKYASWNEGKAALVRDAKAWKAKPDPFGRQKHIFMSLGGATFQPGTFVENDPAREIPPTATAGYPTYAQLFNGIINLNDEYGGIFTGVDLDFEGESRKAFRQLTAVWSKVLQMLRGGAFQDVAFKISCAPEADDRSLDDYLPYINYYDYFMVQFYNNGPSQITSKYNVFWDDVTSNLSEWANKDDAWQHVCDLQPVRAWQYVAMKIQETIQKLFTEREERDLVLTPLVPASTQAAEQFNCWDYTQFCNGLVEGNTGALGTWCIEQDRWNNYVFAKAVSKMFNKPM